MHWVYNRKPKVNIIYVYSQPRMNKPLGCRLGCEKSRGIILVAYYFITYSYYFRGTLKLINQGLFRNYHNMVLTGPLDVDQAGIAAHKVLHLVLRSFPCEHTSQWVHHPNSAENVPGTSADNGKHHQYWRWGSTSGENPWWIHWITLLILKTNIDTKLVHFTGTALPRNIKKPRRCCSNPKHLGHWPKITASCHFRALARSNSSCAWATSRPMAGVDPKRCPDAPNLSKRRF